MRSVRHVLLVAAAALVLAAAATACSSSEPDETLDLGASDSASPDAVAGSVEKWIAVFRSEADPHDMSRDTADILVTAGGAIVVSPAACFEGMPADIPLDSYVLGVVAPSKEELDRVVAVVGRTVIFEGRVRTMCLD